MDARSAVLARAQAFAEQGLVDTCTIRRRTGETEGPGGVIQTTWSDVYVGKCRVQVRAEAGTVADVGEAALVLQHPEVQLPISATGILEGDLIEMTSSAREPDLVGRSYAVRGVLTKSEASSRRVSAIEVTS